MRGLWVLGKVIVMASYLYSTFQCLLPPCFLTYSLHKGQRAGGVVAGRTPGKESGLYRLSEDTSSPVVCTGPGLFALDRGVRGHVCLDDTQTAAASQDGDKYVWIS